MQVTFFKKNRSFRPSTDKKGYNWTTTSPKKWLSTGEKPDFDHLKKVTKWTTTSPQMDNYVTFNGQLRHLKVQKTQYLSHFSRPLNIYINIF